MSKDSETPPPGGHFLVYQTQDGKLKIDVRFEGETVWLTQQHMAELFQTTKQNIGQHLKSIFAGEERIVLALVDFSYVVIVSEREDFVLPWTAYTVEQTHQRNKLQREYEDYWRGQP